MVESCIIITLNSTINVAQGFESFHVPRVVYVLVREGHGESARGKVCMLVSC